MTTLTTTLTTEKPTIKTRTFGLVALMGFIATIPAANWTLAHFGFWNVPGLGPVASGVIWVGLAFCLRDVVQLTIGKYWTLLAIVAGAGLSWWLANPFLAKASLAAFALSEFLDFIVYTPLARRRFLLAVVLSGFLGSLADSALFVKIAFHSYNGWWQLALVKSAIVLLALPGAWAVRRALSGDVPE